MSCPRGGSCRPRIRGTSVAGAQGPISSDKAGALYRYNNSSAYVRGVTLHAQVIERQPRAFLGYHAWQVYYLTQRGSVWLEEGYSSRRPIPVDRYLEHHPGALS